MNSDQTPHYFRVFVDGVPMLYRHGALQQYPGLCTSQDAVETVLYAARHGDAGTYIELRNAV